MMSTYEMTPIQAAVSAFLRAHLERKGRVPSAQEITRQLSRVSRAKIEKSLRALGKKGHFPSREKLPPAERAGDKAPLTARQLAVLEFLHAHATYVGYPPTVREIARRFDISSPNGVVCHLKALEQKGYIRRDRKRSRSIVFTTTAPSAA